jgi:branched-chain amino acid transport system permease protein
MSARADQAPAEAADLPAVAGGRPAAPGEGVRPAAAPTSAIPRAEFDGKPLLLLAAIALAGLPLIGSPSTWLTLTIAGLAMGMIVFIIASGLTLVFGLMDVLNFGHGVFIALGAFVATSVFAGLGDWTGSASPVLNFGAVFLAMLAAMAVAGAVGYAFERVIVRPVYGQHLKQILITMGGMIVGEEIIKLIWGPAQLPLPLPEVLRGAVLIPVFGESAAVEKYRLLAVAIGAIVLAKMLYALNRTKLGLLVRAGVQDREMVESLGYPISRLFIGVFVVGSALAGLGGVMWGLYQQTVTPQMGAQVNVLIFIVIIIGGLGSTLGCFVGALLVGLMANYVGFLAPKLAMFSNIGLMVAILLWRPQGLYPVTNR